MKTTMTNLVGEPENTANRASPYHEQNSATNGHSDHTEGILARMIEEHSAKLPSDFFLWAAFGSIGCSLFLHACGRKHGALSIGQWVPTILLLGLYNKLVKIAGSEPLPLNEKSPDQGRFQFSPDRHITIELAPSIHSTSPSSPPRRAGMKRDRSDSDRSEEGNIANADLPGNRGIYVIVRQNEERHETPVFSIENETADAVMVFTHREDALLYLQVANWTSYGLRELSPIELSRWAPALEGDHVAFLIVNANRRHQENRDGIQHAIDIRALQDLSGENLFQEIMGTT